MNPGAAGVADGRADRTALREAGPPNHHDDKAVRTTIKNSLSENRRGWHR